MSLAPPLSVASRAYLANRLCAVLVLVVVSATAQAPPDPSQKVVAENLDGRSVNPFALSAGHPLVLLFVRTDCPISNRYAPLLQQLSERYRGSVNFWLVYPDASQTAPQIQAHLDAYHYSIPALRDTHHALVARAHATITPEAAVFSNTGQLLYHGRIDNWYEDFARSRPAPTSHELASAVEAALHGKTVNPDHANAVGCYISDLR